MDPKDVKIRRATASKKGFVPTASIMKAIMKYLDTQTCIKLQSLCKTWCGLAAEAFYDSPPLAGDSFQKLVCLLACNSTQPYALMIQELVFDSSAAHALLMGDLDSTLKLCTNLKSLRLEGCTQLSLFFAEILAESAPSLSRLSLSGCALTDLALLQIIRRLRNLRYIDVSYTNVTLSMLPRLARECEKLEFLDMTRCEAAPEDMVIDYEESEYFLVGDTLKHYKSQELKVVALSHTSLDDDMLNYLVRHCSSLETLLLDFTKISDRGMASIAMHSPRLKVLNVAGCNITDDGLKSLAIHLSDPVSRPRDEHSRIDSSFSATIDSSYLEKIDLSGTTVTKSGICILAKKSPKLATIIVDGCERVTAWYLEKSENSSDSGSLDGAPHRLSLHRDQLIHLSTP